MLEIPLIRNPHETRKYLYKKSSVTLTPGLNVIIGRNGVGKSTFCHQAANYCKQVGIPCYSYDNYHDGADTARQQYLFNDDLISLASVAFHSEGEQIFYNLGQTIVKINTFLQKHREHNQIVIVLDAIDSGLDVEGISQLIDLIKTITAQYHDCYHCDVYFIVTANNYALIHKQHCIDIYTSRYLSFVNYDEFESFILNQYKQKRSKSK